MIINFYKDKIVNGLQMYKMNPDTSYECDWPISKEVDNIWHNKTLEFFELEPRRSTVYFWMRICESINIGSENDKLLYPVNLKNFEKVLLWQSAQEDAEPRYGKPFRTTGTWEFVKVGAYLGLRFVCI